MTTDERKGVVAERFIALTCTRPDLTWLDVIQAGLDSYENEDRTKKKDQEVTLLMSPSMMEIYDLIKVVFPRVTLQDIFEIGLTTICKIALDPHFDVYGEDRADERIEVISKKSREEEKREVG